MAYSNSASNLEAIIEDVTATRQCDRAVTEMIQDPYLCIAYEAYIEALQFIEPFDDHYDDVSPIQEMTVSDIREQIDPIALPEFSEFYRRATGCIAAYEHHHHPVCSIAEYLDDIEEYCDAKQLGHDFALTRNRHGAGFWDGTNWHTTIGNILTDIANSFGERNLYVGDDGQVDLV